MAKFINTDTILGAGASALAFALLQSSVTQSAGVFILPGDAPPFLVPQLMLYLMLVVAGIILLQGICKGGVAVGRKNWRSIFLSVIVIALAAGTMQSLGFLIVAPIAVFFVVVVLGYRNDLINLAGSLGVVGLLYLILVECAQMPLPQIPGMGF